jgi:hypothetical protein
MHNGERLAFIVVQSEFGAATLMPQIPLTLTYQGRSSMVLGPLNTAAAGD